MDGMYRYIRSPNYLGEVMIYASYAIVANVGDFNLVKCSIGFLGSFSFTFGPLCLPRGLLPRRNEWKGLIASFLRLDILNGRRMSKERMRLSPSSSSSTSLGRIRVNEVFVLEKGLSLFMEHGIEHEIF